MPQFTLDPVRKRYLYIIILIIVILVIVGLISYYAIKKEAEKPQVTEEETIIEKQLRELTELREKANSQPLTEKEIKKQLEELNKLRQTQ